ncbi:MAG: hypothetical protein ABN482_09625 [Corticimicrobacter sp.]|uniref:hypothetical protein n=1 Tax=Corticimicrobacter sp. TaxID=2678536 RepID=UPI0032DBEEA1
MSSLTDWIVAGSSVTTAVGVVFVAFQALLARRSLKADHERSRRENAIKLLMHMDVIRQRQSSIARKFAETLSFEQSKALLNQESFKVDSKHRELLLGCISKESNLHNSTKDSDSQIEIPVSDSADIRWQIVSYLNNLESTLSAWRHNVADRNMLEEQYQFLISPSEGHYLLKEFRKAAGGPRHFPSIEEFVSHIENKPRGSSGKEKVA